MALNALGMGFVFTAKDLATSIIGKVSASIKEFAKSSEAAAAQYERSNATFKSGAKMLGAGVAGMAGLVKGTTYFGEYQYNLASVGQVMRATTEELELLDKAAIRAGIDTQFSPVDAVQGLQALGAAGLGAKDAMKVLLPTLDLAAASLGQLTVEQASEAVIGSINAFGMQADKAGEIVDKLTRVTQASNFQARDFAIGISNAAAQAKGANQTYDSMLAVLGMLRNTNLDASSSATAYREATRRLAGEEIAHRALKKLGIDVLDKEKNQIRDIVSIIGEMIPALEKVDAKKKNTMLTDILGVRGMKTYNAVLAQYEKALKDGDAKVGDYGFAHRRLLGELENSAGAAGKNRDALLATEKGMKILLQGSWQTFQVMLGETLSPVLYPALKLVTTALNEVIYFVKGIPGPIKSFMSYAIGFGSLFLTIAGAIKITIGAIGLYKLAIQAAAAAQAAAGITMLGAGGGGMFASIGAAASAAIPFIVLGGAVLAGVWAAEKAADAEWKKRQAEKFADQEKSIALYKKTREVMHDVKQEIAATLELEIKAAKQDMGKALSTLEKLQGDIGPLKIATIDAHRKFVEVSTKSGAKESEIAAAHAEWAKAASQLRAKEMARVDIEAIVAEKKMGLSKDATEKRFQAENIIAGRFVKQQAMEEKLSIWSIGQQQYIEGLKKEGSKDYGRKAAEYRQTYDARMQEIKAWQKQTAVKAAGWGISDVTGKGPIGAQRRQIAAVAMDHVSTMAMGAENQARLALVALQAHREAVKAAGGPAEGARDRTKLQWLTGATTDLTDTVGGSIAKAAGYIWEHKGPPELGKAKGVGLAGLAAMFAETAAMEGPGYAGMMRTGAKYEEQGMSTPAGRAAMAREYRYEEVTINLQVDGETLAKVVRKADGKMDARKGGIGPVAKSAPAPSGAKK